MSTLSQPVTIEQIKQIISAELSRNGGEWGNLTPVYSFFSGKVSERGIDEIAITHLGLVRDINDLKVFMTPHRAQIVRGQQQAAQQAAQQAYTMGTLTLPSIPMPYPTGLQQYDPTPVEKKPRVKRVVEKKKVGFESVVISDGKKEEIQAAISQIKNDETIFGKWGFADVFEKGTAISLLFWGIPGTGKTLTAQAIADEVGAKLKIVGNAEIQSSEPGGAEREIKTIFATAKRGNKSGEKIVLLFDECDSLLTDRNEVGVILGSQVNTLLTELEKYEGIIIFTTNRMGKLDPALERRITAKIEFVFPDKKQRKEIWKRMIPKKAPIDKDVDFDKLAEYPLAGGNIKNSVLNAARLAAYKKAKKISMAHFVEAIEREAKALQSFVAEYEKQSHQSLVGYATHSAHGGLVVKNDAKAVIKKRGGDNY